MLSQFLLLCWLIILLVELQDSSDGRIRRFPSLVSFHHGPHSSHITCGMYKRSVGGCVQRRSPLHWHDHHNYSSKTEFNYYNFGYHLSFLICYLTSDNSGSHSGKCGYVFWDDASYSLVEIVWNISEDNHLLPYHVTSWMYKIKSVTIGRW